MTDIATRIKSVVARFINIPHVSAWEFNTSSGGELGISIPETKIGVVGSVTNLYITKDKGQTVNGLSFGGLGVSAGLQLVPLPFNFSFSLKEMPSSGTIITGPLAPAELSLNDFKGAAMLCQVSAQGGPGESAAVMFMGGNNFAYSTLGPGGIVVTAKAIVFFYGMNANLLPFAFGGSAVVGYVI